MNTTDFQSKAYSILQLSMNLIFVTKPFAELGFAIQIHLDKIPFIEVVVVGGKRFLSIFFFLAAQAVK